MAGYRLNASKQEPSGGKGGERGATRRKPGPPLPPAAAVRFSTVELVILCRPAEGLAAAQDRLRLMLAAWIVCELVKAQGEEVYTGSPTDAAATGPSERPVASEGPARQAAPPEVNDTGGKSASEGRQS